MNKNLKEILSKIEESLEVDHGKIWNQNDDLVEHYDAIQRTLKLINRIKKENSL